MAAKTFPVEASHILMFARSVGDDNKVYSDPDYAKTTESASPGSGPARIRPASSAPKAEAEAEAGCMPSSTSNITAT